MDLEEYEKITSQVVSKIQKNEIAQENARELSWFQLMLLFQ